ncbi:MAG: murein biosynthesis integral membrane protein MurJ [Gemmatimonadetes bacterium]|nr:murein biosynthesis integral membrane protein MurJ [Gemmatimonadota bacterium]
MVAAGIFVSRVVGLVRQRVLSHYLGQSAVADAFNAAFRIPNVLQNLFGEGALSASFIPEYVRLRSSGDEAGARRLAGAVAGLLGTVVLVLVAVGVAAAPWLVDILALGFSGPTRELTVALVRILFPGIGLLVLSAWCLGILNSHHRFFLSYAAPVVWSLAIIGAALAAAGGAPERLVIWAAWGAVAGSALQLLVQLPTALRLAGSVRPSLDRTAPSVGVVLRNFGPAFLSRGVGQISAYFDTIIGSLLPAGGLTALTNAQALYTLPISLFGMSVAASELPAMSVAAGSSVPSEALRARIMAGTDRVAFFVIPTVFAFLFFGHLVAGLVFQTGRFGAEDARWVWGTLAASSLGLLPQASGRILSSAHYALGDTRRPLRFAAIRLAVGVVIGYAASQFGPGLLGIDDRWGTAGLGLAAAIGGTLEFGLLRRSLEGTIGSLAVDRVAHAKLWASGLVATAVGWLVAVAVPPGAPFRTAALVLGVFGLTYLGVTAVVGVGRVRDFLARIRR